RPTVLKTAPVTRPDAPPQRPRFQQKPSGRARRVRLAASVSFPIMPALFRFPLPKEQPLPLKDLISIHDLTPKEIRQIFTTTADLKAHPRNYCDALAGRSVALIFEKPSLRTRVTFDLGATQMGASCVYLDHQGVRLGERESVKDMALNLERWVDVIVARTYSHETVIELAAHSSAPVINGLSEFSHPCQGLT